MKNIKIGQTTFKPKAIKQIILCLFLNGILIGGLVAYIQSSSKSVNILIVFALLILPYLLLKKEISKNMIKDDNSK